MQRRNQLTVVLSSMLSSPAGSRLHRSRCSWLPAAAVLAATLLAPQYPASALDFDLVFDSAQSDFPDFDPDGSKLMSMMEEAASRWSDAVVTSHTMKINFVYADVPGADAGVLSSFQSRTNEGIIRFSKSLNWWFDPTPSTDSEFHLFQTLYRDLSPTQQQAGFSGSSPQPLLEVGFRGITALQAAQNNYDALSVALHEIGHLMGVTSQLSGSQADTVDGDYDLQPLKIGGADMGVMVNGGDIAHFANPLPIMGMAETPQGTRVLPTATDFLAASKISGWDLDLPRVEFVGPDNGDFHNLYNWVGSRVPNGDNDVYVSHGGVLQLSQNATTRDLNVDDGSSIVTNGNILRTFGDTYVGLEFPGLISVQDFTGSGNVPELDTQDLTIGGDGTVHVVNSNSLVDVHGDLTIDVGGRLLGAGNVEVDGGINNNGIITGGAALGLGTGGTLTLNISPVGGKIDLDGTSDAGRVNALDNGSVVVNGQILDGFDGEMRIGAGKFVGFNSNFELGPTGRVEMLGGVDNASLVSLEEMSLGGTVVVDKHAAIVAPVQTSPSTVIEVPDADDRLELTELTRLGGGTFNGQGEIRQLGDLHVFGDTTINTAVYDWDGDSQSKTTITSDGVLTINSQQFDDTGDTGHDGIIALRGGVLNVNTPSGWRVDNRIDLHAGSTINGAEIEVASGAQIQTIQLFPFQNTVVNAPLRIASGAVVDARDEKLLLGGRTTFDGGILTGLRTVTQAGDVVVESDSLVDLDVYEWDGGSQNHSTTIKSGATWYLFAEKIANSVFPFVDGYDGSIDVEDGGTLSVNLTNDPSWKLDGTLSIAGPSAVTGDDVENRGRIQGVGSIDTNVINNGVVSPGVSLGRLDIAGDYQQSAFGSLEIDLAGLIPESEYDVLAATSASIDGVLSIELAEGFLPAPGTRFDFLTTSQSLTGDFSELQLIAPPGVLFDGSIVKPSATELAFEVSYAVHEADFNEDGDVDQDDLSTWQANFGLQSGGDHTLGDGNVDGFIDGRDFLSWQRQSHVGNTSTAALGIAQAVPESSSLLLMLVAGATSMLWRTRLAHAKP